MTNENESHSRKCFKTAFIAGGTASLLFLVGNRKSREKIVRTTKSTAETINQTSRFIATNREKIMDDLSITTKQLSELLRSASEDIQFIAKRVSHLKETTSDVKNTTQKVAQEFRELKDETSKEGIEDIKTIKQQYSPSNGSRFPESKESL